MQQNWIWLDPVRYPDTQETVFNGWCDKQPHHYAMAEFKRTYTFPAPIREAVLTYSGDTEFRLYCNGQFVATGPACAGGDFYISNEEPWPTHYAFQSTLHPAGNTLDFFAYVKMMPVRINEFSMGHGGFMLHARVRLTDGTVTEITTDPTWLCRKNHAFVAPDYYDGTKPVDEYAPAAAVDNRWHSAIAPIPPRIEQERHPNTFTVPPHEKIEVDYEYPLVYSGFIHLTVQTESHLTLQVDCRETQRVDAHEYFDFVRDTDYISPGIRSVGGYHVYAENHGDTPATVTLSVLETHFPLTRCAHTVTSDEDLNLVLRVCEHSLKSCMQTMEVESVLHCEPMACTGDYYVEMMMTATSYGDLRLAEFDIRRTADILRVKRGEMFHATYSMIWILMLYDAYRFTGHKALLADCEDALRLLLDAFASYLDDTGLVDDPPSYMFVDWATVNGISLHHPPKALGQTFLNLFYYGGLTTAAQIYAALDNPAAAEDCRQRAAALKRAINIHLYDPQRGLYFEGRNTPTREERLCWYMPQNVEKRYFRRHSNVLAALFEVCDAPADLLRRTLQDDSLGYYQPYFAHFVLEAVRQNGLCAEFTRSILEDWKEPIRSCPKGLPEGFYKQDDYPFDHSHGWGGTPLYALPMALSGLEVLTPGMERIRLRPTLLGLEHATVEIPFPTGMLRIEMEQGKEPVITVPYGVTVEKSEGE